MSDRAISEAIRRLAGTKTMEEIHYASAEVNSVDIKNRTCEVTTLDGLAGYELTAKLMAVKGDGILLIPVIGSTVKVIFSQLVEPFVCQYSDIDTVIIDSKTKVQLNDGSFGGMIKINDLVNKINTLESDLNRLKTAFNGWNPVLSDGLTLKAASLAWASTSIQKTNVSDIENKTVTHGK